MRCERRWPRRRGCSAAKSASDSNTALERNSAVTTTTWGQLARRTGLAGNGTQMSQGYPSPAPSIAGFVGEMSDVELDVDFSLE